MDQPTHIIDPDGEVMIILSNANAPFAPEAYVTEKANEVSVENESSEFTMSEIFGDDEKDKDLTKPRFCIQVSAKHLTIASPVFKKLLTGLWKESVTFLQKGSVEITTESWDPEAFLILLRIMHCQLSQMPRKLTVEMLAKVAVIADYYNCKDVTRFFVLVWIEAFEEKFPTTYSRELILWLWISWAFQYEKQFKMITSTAMSHSDGEINSLGLPIPDRVIGKLDPSSFITDQSLTNFLPASINRGRQEAIENIFNLLHEKHEALLDGKLGCRFECSSIMYGALTKQMKSTALLAPRPFRPFRGLNYNQLVQKVRSFTSPEWYSQLSYYNKYVRHSCSNSSFESLLGKMDDSVNGLVLLDFIS
ncbi:hypothetical protein ZTR_03716 [Talaromyces verruculosus]|nr:hypothetical protein ZTR_03716 [Talaromyces verruculosus]